MLDSSLSKLLKKKSTVFYVSTKDSHSLLGFVHQYKACPPILLVLKPQLKQAGPFQLLHEAVPARVY